MNEQIFYFCVNVSILEETALDTQQLSLCTESRLAYNKNPIM